MSAAPAGPGLPTARSGDPRFATGLTAAQAAIRSAAVADVRYRIGVDLSRLSADGTYRVTTEIRFSCATVDAPIWLDLIAGTVVSVEHNGSTLDPQQVSGPERLLLTDPRRDNTLVVHTVNLAGTEAAGLCRSQDATDGTVYAWTQFQPFDARRMFPCFDQPDIRGTVAMTVTAPAEWTCLSNGSPTAITEVAAHLSRTAFAVTPAIPAYLVAVCAGPFASVQTEHRGITLGVHARASLAAELATSAPELFDLTRHGLDTYTQAFGTSYPLDSYDQVFLPDQPGAMENMGCTTWSDGSIYRATPTMTQRARRALVLLHELSHQWFGNLVSPRWWDDLWLSESFADWAAVWALRTYPGLGGYPGTDGSAHVTVAMVADQLPSTHPVSRMIPDIDTVAASFDAITYSKGAAMLRQLVNLVGEEQFLAGVRGYLRRFEWSSAAIDGLVDEIGRACTVDVRRWAVEWLRTAGINTLSLHRVPAAVPQGEAHSTSAPRTVVRQTATARWPLLRSHRLSVGRYAVREDTLVPIGLSTVAISGSQTDVAAPDISEPLEVLLPNDGLTDYAKTRTDEHSLNQLLRLAHTLDHPNSRGAVRALLMDMLFDAELSGPAAVDTLVRMLATERDDAGLSGTIELALEAAHLYTDPAGRGPGGTRVAEACLSVTGQLAEDDPRWITAWHAITRAAWTPAQTSRILALLDSPHVPQALRWRGLTRLLSLELAGADDVAAEQRRDHDPDSARSAQIALAARPTTAAKREALELLLSPVALPIGSLGRLGEAIWQPHQEGLLRPVVRAYLRRLPQAIAAGGPARAMRLTRYAFPTAGLDLDTIAAAEALAARADLPQIARQALADQSAISARRLRTAALVAPSG
jgi:aminopeptidase N